MIDKEFIRKFMAIALPVALMNLINFGVKAVDTMMLGLVGEVQLSAAAVASQLPFTQMIFTFGISSGCSVLIAQFWGAGDKIRVHEIFGFMCRIMVFVNIIFAAIAFFIPQYMMGIITTDPEVIVEGVIYLRIMSVGLLIWGFTSALSQALRSVGVVNISVVMFSISLAVSASLNYILIFGHFGFPALGIAGAAIATVVARFVEFIILAVYLLKFEKNFGFRAGYLFKRSKGLLSSFTKHGMPVVANEVFWALGFFILNIVIGRMGREFVAANAVGSLLVQLAGMIIFSLSSATAVVIGNTIGEGRYENARKFANSMILVSLVVGFVSFAFIQAIRVPFVNFYELSDTARLYAMQLTHIISVFVVFNSVDGVALMGTLRGGGDAKFVMVVDIIFMWMVSIPLGAFAGLVLGWPVWLVFIIIRSDTVFKAVLVLWRVPSGKWLKDVTRV